jgi:hypothetical protein
VRLSQPFEIFFRINAGNTKQSAAPAANNPVATSYATWRSFQRRSMRAAEGPPQCVPWCVQYQANSSA